MKNDNEIELDIANEKIEELSQKLIIAGHQMMGLHNLINQLTNENIELAHDNNLGLASERVWEIAMMKAIGENGPGSVADAIKSLKEEKISLEMTLSNYVMRS